MTISSSRERKIDGEKKQKKEMYREIMMEDDELWLQSEEGMGNMKIL